VNEARRTVAAELLAASRAHDAAQEDRLDRYRNLEPESAELLAVLVKATRPSTILEVGTSNGYSTIWLADAAEAVGGSVVSLEVEQERTEMARSNLSDAGVLGRVELRVEDAGEALAGYADDAWDLVFLDAERPAYVGYWPDLVRVLRPNGLLVVDNTLSHANQLVEFSELVHEDGRVTSTLVTVGAGVLLVVKSA
jgi:predicted O-methyltransferase YrrM